MPAAPEMVWNPAIRKSQGATFQGPPRLIRKFLYIVGCANFPKMFEKNGEIEKLKKRGPHVV